MATYSQWARARALKPVAWVCGAEPVLVRAVLDAYRDGTPADCQDVLFAGGHDGELWDALLSDPLPTFPRLIIVYRAEKIRAWEPLATLLAAADPAGPRTVFVSGAADFEQDKGKNLAPHLAAAKKSRHAQLIRCCAPSRSEDLVNLVCGWWPGLSRNQAWSLLSRGGGGLTAAAAACDKAVRAGLPASDANIALVTEPEPGAAFADALVTGRRREAMAAAQQASRWETGYGLAVLTTRLSQLAAIHAAQKAGAGPRDLAARTRLSRWAVSQLAAHAGPYDQGRVSRCRELLAMAEARHRSGAAGGVAQSVVAAW